MRRLALLAVFAATLAHAQTSPNLFQGQVPTPTQWNSYFSNKVDYSTTPVGSVSAADHIPDQPNGTGATQYASVGSIAAFIESDIGNLGAVFGPTAVGSPSANPPVQIGGASNTSGTGTVYPMVCLSTGYCQVQELNSTSSLTALNSAVTALNNAITVLNSQLAALNSQTPNCSATPNCPGSIGAVNTFIGGAAADANAGAAGANTQRVVIATGGATPLPTGAATAANQNLQNIGATAFLPGGVTAVSGVSGSPTLILAARTGGAGAARVSATIIQSASSVPLFLCATAACTAGARLPAAEGASITILTTSAIYGYVASGTAAITEYENF